MTPIKAELFSWIILIYLKRVSLFLIMTTPDKLNVPIILNSKGGSRYETNGSL